MPLRRVALVVLALALCGATGTQPTYQATYKLASAHLGARPRRLADAAQAAEHAANLAATDDERARALVLLGSIRRRQTRLDDARRALDRAAELKGAPADIRARARQRAGQALQAQKQFDEAITRYRLVAAMADVSPAVRGACQRVLGDCLRLKGDVAAALEAYAAVVALQGATPRDVAKALLATGEALAQRGETDAACAAYRRVAALPRGQPSDRAKALRAAAQLRTQTGDHARARAALADLLALPGLDQRTRSGARLASALTWWAQRDLRRARQALGALAADTEARRNDRKQAEKYAKVIDTRLARPARGPAEAPCFAFGVLADVQYADQPTRGRRRYRESLAKVAACADDLNRRKLTFTIHLGDLVDVGAGNLDTLLTVWRRLRMPTYHTIGNHDYVLPYPDLLKALRLGPGYYDFAVENWRFVVLNGGAAGQGDWPDGSDEARQAVAFRQRIREKPGERVQGMPRGLGPRQEQWLARVLRDAATRRQRVVVCCHYPLHPDQIPSKHPFYFLADRDRIRRMLEQAKCVAAYFAGHYHKGGYAEHAGVHYMTFQGMVESPPGVNAYSVVEVFSDRLEVHGVGTHPSRTLHLPPKR